MRFSKTAKGNMCRRCIDAVFKEMTLTTLFTGWFGLISMIITPIFIIGNVMQYLSIENLPLATINNAQAGLSGTSTATPKLFSLKKYLLIGLVCAFLLFVLFGAGLVALGVMVSNMEAKDTQRCQTQRNADEKSPQQFEKSKAYLNDCLAGTGSLVQYKGRSFAVTAEHPFEDGPLPTEFFQLDLNRKIPLVRKLIAKNDLLVFEVFDLPSETPPLLSYTPDFVIKRADAIAVLTTQGFVMGDVITISDVTLPRTTMMYAKMKKPFKAQGCSGGAVIQVATGRIIGILETANDPEAATTIGFKLLNMRDVK